MFNEYFTAKYLLSKGAIFNGAFSDRSDGKTFDCKVRALENYKERGLASIYLRRYKTEITEKMYTTFFNEILEIEPYKSLYEGWQFKGTKQGVYVKKKPSDKWEIIVYFIALTMTGKLKSQFEVKRIENIDFDEYVPLDGRYAPSEMDLINEFYKSIDRDRDIVRFNFFGNKITYFCPLFDFFKVDLKLDAKETIRLYQGGTLAIQIYVSKEHREKREKSKFNRLMKGTSYEDYNNGGILNALDLKVEQHNENSKCFASFKTIIGEGTIWYNKNNDFIISCVTRNDMMVICDNYYNISRESILIKFGKLASDFKNMYRLGRIKFESDKAFHIFEPILKCIR